MKKIPLTVVIVVIILLLGLVARASMNNRALDKRFREEMASRFDVEQKAMSFEKERAALYARIKSLNAELEKDQATIGDLRKSLELAAQENNGLRDSLSQLRNNIEAQPASGADGTM
ncbi:MAG: hypothetical protein ACM3L6_01240 [Deltaproteobacteria bacterium]